MASVYPRGVRWWVKYRDPIKRAQVRESLGPEVRTKAQALVAARALERRVERQDAIPETITLGVALSRFLDDKAPPFREAWTHATYTKHIAHFRRLLPCDLLIAQLSSAHIKRYRDARTAEGVKPQTVNKERTTLSTIWRWAQRENDPPLVPLDRNPVAAVAPLRFREIEAEPCAEPVFRAVVAALRSEAIDDTTLREAEHYDRELYADALEVAWSTGLRAGEIAALRPEDVRLDAREMTITAAWNKGAAPTYPIPEEVVAILASRIARGKAWVFSALRGGNAYRSLYKFWSVWVRAKIAKDKRRRAWRTAHIHALRHAYTTALDRAGVSEAVTMKLTRHRTPRVRLRYTHRDLDDMRAAQRALASARQPRSDPPPPE